MAIIHIDGKTYEVDGADNLLQACLSLGFDVPYFCYHPALGSVGSCRQCAVKQYNTQADYEAGNGRLVMSCMVNPTENMYISVTDAEVKAFRKSMVEFLMTNHPHDCPTCEEGGHCHLQDMTYMSGHHHRRYRFTKRTHHNQDLGAFINHEMNRCIACYRCVRFYKDYAGGEDLGVYASASRVYFGRDQDGQFESEFSGNLTEVCPTGVFTDKTHSDRYNRKWDMQYAPSICHGCSSGCNISAGERYGELRRIENRYHGEVNGYFLCDRGRFGYGYVNRQDRHIHPLEQINGKQEIIHLDYAIDSVKQRLQGKKVLGIGSPVASLESNFALKQLVGVGNFSTGLSQKEQQLIAKCIEILTTEGIYNPSMLEIESYDAVLILGEDITQTASRVALSVRQAAKNKAKEMAIQLKTPTWLAEPVKRIGQNEYSPIFVIDVKQTKLDDLAKVSCVATPHDIAKLAFQVADCIQQSDDDVLPKDLSVVDGDNQQMTDFAKHIAQTLLKAKKPLIISGTALQDVSIIEAAGEIAQQLTDKRQAILRHEQKIVQLHNAQVAEEIANNPEDNTPMMTASGDYIAQAGLYLALPYANGVGVNLLGGLAVEEVLSQTADVLVVMENDLTQILPQHQLQQLFANKTLIVLDHQQYPWHKLADVLLPVATFAEADGTLVSAEGRAQRFFQVYDPVYYNPQNMVKESWRWLHAIDSELRHQGIVWTQLDDIVQIIAKNYPSLAGIKQASPTADYRISGLKIAREPRRYSGRTAMRANLSIHEPQQPVDKDTGLTFSMEGYVGDETDSSMIPFAWSAGWNSPQAWNKYQDKVGGHLKQGDPGVRLFDGMPRLPRRQYVANLATLGQDIQLVPIYNLFASSAYASRSEVVASQLMPAMFSVCADDAKLWGIEDKQLLTLSVNDETISLPVQVVDYLAENCIGYPVGQATTISTLLNQTMGAVVVKIAHVGERVGEGA